MEYQWSWSRGRDQGGVAARVEHLGVAAVISRGELTDEQLTSRRAFSATLLSASRLERFPNDCRMMIPRSSQYCSS